VGYVFFTLLVCTILVSLNISRGTDIVQDDDEDNNNPHSPMPQRGSFVFFDAPIAPDHSSITLQSQTNALTYQSASLTISSRKKLELGLAPNHTERAANPEKSVYPEVSSAFGLTGSVSDTCLSSHDQASDSLIRIPSPTLSVCVTDEKASVVDNKKAEGNPDLTRQGFTSPQRKHKRCTRMSNHLQNKPRGIAI